MRTTITIDDDILAKAKEFSGITENSALVREALRVLVERERARRAELLLGRKPRNIRGSGK
jgi:Arc/MetJ family transcription regulator